MVKDYPSENWKNVVFDFEYVNELRLEVSNFGRIRSYNKVSQGNLLKGSMVNGYNIVRLKFFKEREEKAHTELTRLRAEIAEFTLQIKSISDEAERNTAKEKLASLKKTLARKVKADDKKRVIHYHSLIHRLVATYFLPAPTADQTVVAHLDYNKQNNRSYNLKWMTAEENYAHQKNSPFVIAELDKKFSNVSKASTTKLSTTKVMLLKKLLNQNKPIRLLAKQFRITDTQVIRIKKGENWKDIDAAK